jgi:hypothetical protein
MKGSKNSEPGSKVLKDLAARLQRSQESRDVEINVEDILDVAVEGVSSDGPLLKKLKERYSWPDVDRSPAENSPRIVPLGRWADVVIAYLEGGIPRLVDLAIAQNSEDASFPLGVLEALGNLESVQAVARIAKHAWRANPKSEELACLCAKTLNLQIGIPNSIEVPDDIAKQIRELLHDMIQGPHKVRCIPDVCYTLRGVGNEESIRILKKMGSFQPPYQTLEASVTKAIQKRLKK